MKNIKVIKKGAKVGAVVAAKSQAQVARDMAATVNSWVSERRQNAAAERAEALRVLFN